MFASKDVFLTPPSTGGYTIARSVRLRSSASAYFNRTLTTPTNNLKWTWSAWIKLGTYTTSYSPIFAAGTSGSAYSAIWFNSNSLVIYSYNGATAYWLNTSQVFRDYSGWYNITIAFDSAQATSTNRIKLYINGVQVTAFSTATYPSLNYSDYFDSAIAHYIGQFTPALGSIYYDGYMTEINFIDGQALTPSSFGETDSITGVWKPKAYSGTYGTNGFYLNFSDNSNNTAATIGKDYSGNANNWTPNNISVTAGATYDSMVDSPTVGATSSNYCVLNPLVTPATTTIVDGNLGLSGYTAYSSETGTIGVSSGKWYFEFVAQLNAISGITGTPNGSYYPGQAANAYAWDSANTQKYNNNTGASYGAATSAGDIVGVAYDLDGGSITFYKNNVSQGTAYTFTPSGTYFPVVRNGSATNTAVNFGQRPFSYTPPTGFVALNTNNLPASTITNGAAYMNTLLYTGDGNTIKSITGLSFAPDFVWHKTRSNADDHRLVDIVRGGGTDLSSSILYSNLTNAQDNSSGYITQTSSGFNLGVAATPLNMSGRTYVAWNWKANGAGVSNTNGSITSTVSAGATQGFSVVTYTGNGTAGATIGHGLGVVPTFIIVKNRSSTQNWLIYSAVYGANMYGYLNNTNPWVTDTTGFNNVIPTSTVFSVGTALETNGNGNSLVAYCFTPVKGYSAFGSYTGNGSADGPFVYLGFRPRWLMIKRSSSASVTYGWQMYDTSRQPANTASSDPNLWADTSAAEGTGNYTFDLLSNGFKLRSSGVNENASGDTYIYAAFAENPFKNALAR